jgi:hypothetical protein
MAKPVYSKSRSGKMHMRRLQGVRERVSLKKASDFFGAPKIGWGPLFSELNATHLLNR